MPDLKLIAGPPNSGKAGAIRARLEAAITRDPVLVVPTMDDVDRFEAELSRAAGEGSAVLGASIRTFDRLFDEVAAATGTPLPPPLTRIQVLHVVRLAVAGTELGILRRSARHRGFAPALATLIGELQAAGIDPQTLAANAAEANAGADADDGGYLSELARLYSAYVDTRDDLGRGDAHLAAARATAALRDSPDAWGARPVFFYGFDDLTVEQLELVRALADAAEVTFAVPYEDRRAYAARARLLEELKERGATIAETLEPDPANTASRTLYELERGFLRDDVAPIALDDGLVVLEAAGERNQAEQIASEVAQLLAGGVAPDDIAIAVRDPDREGPLLATVLESADIPAAVEARAPIEATATGRALAALVRAARPAGTAQDLLGFVRGPDVARPSDADWLERTILRRRLRTAAEAREAWQAHKGRELFELDELTEAIAAGPPGTVHAALARFARRIAEHPWSGLAESSSRELRLEARAGEAAASAFEKLAELPALADAAADALAVLDSLDLTLWQGPTEGHVLVASPYRIRARRVRHLFVASLQEGEFPRHGAGEPFLSDEQRGALRLPERADPDEEERYLFAVCLSRPTERLHLCWQRSDDEGVENAPSPFLDDVRRLIATPSDDTEAEDPLARTVRRRHLADVVMPLHACPSPTELARAVVAAGPGVEPAGLEGVGPELATAIAAGIAAAAERTERDRPGPLTVPAVLGELREREQFGASTLEGYAVCSYRWFVQHELDPRELEAEPEPRASGSVIHAVLERLYRDPPAGVVPELDTLEAWRERAAALIEELAPEHGLGSADARGLAARARMVALVEGQLEREAGTVSALRPDPELLEASFGYPDDPVMSLDLGDGILLHGKIDRVDVSPEGGAALIRDYKVSRTVTLGSNLAKEGKLQPQLYALALRELWHKRPLGGLYQPLAGTSSHTPRGIAAKEDAEAGGLLDGLGLAKKDLLDAAALAEALENGAAEARRIAGEMRNGQIDRNPLDDSCPPFCTFQAICRRERGARIEPEPGEEEEEEV